MSDKIELEVVATFDGLYIVPLVALERGTDLCRLADAKRLIRAALAKQPAPVNKSVIRDVFLRNGFTIKEGQTDLKPYVYAAAEELLSLDGKAVAAAPAAPVAQEPVAFFWEDTVPHVEGRRHGPYFGWPTDEALARVAGSAKPVPLYTAPPVVEQPDSTTSDKYRAELYDEVWEKARSMGHGNVTEALVELERMKAAGQPSECGNCFDGKSDMEHVCRKCGGTGKQPDTVAVPRELLERVWNFYCEGDGELKDIAMDCYALLAGGAA